MTDDDRLRDTLAQQERHRVLVDGCAGCQRSAVFCRATTYLMGGGQLCCPSCSH